MSLFLSSEFRVYNNGAKASFYKHCVGNRPATKVMKLFFPY